MENFLALLKEYLNINLILQVKEAYRKNIFKGYLSHQNITVPEDSLEIDSPYHPASSHWTMLSIRSFF